MLFLRREQAPISAGAWEEIDAEATRTLQMNLAARRLLDFRGPLGWETSAVNLGRVDALKAAPHEGVSAVQRQVLPLVELRADFTLSRTELANVDRGADDVDLEPLIGAALKIAAAEDEVAFNGYGAGGIRGVLEASPHQPLRISEDYSNYPDTVAQAAEVLRQAGVTGPYAIALGPRCYAGLISATNEGGYPLLNTLENILKGPIVRAPQIDGACVLSVRGGDFELVVGQDFSVGFDRTEGDTLHLYLVESLSARVVAPEAAVALRYGS